MGLESSLQPRTVLEGLELSIAGVKAVLIILCSLSAIQVIAWLDQPRIQVIAVFLHWCHMPVIV